jgi:uncharacterized membrane protein YphA (DoxX/SURF4 family)
MGEVGAAAALLLAALFAWTGARKAVRPEATAASFRALGIPRAAVTARVLPIAELLIAALLVVAPRAGALLAVVALAGFSLVLGRALANGVEAGCGCFGATATDPVSAADLVRNAFLAGGATVAGLTASARIPSLPATVLVAGAALTGVLVMALLRLRARVGGVFPHEPTGARP